jgi:molybdenum cofactor cytidylyltransferase
MTQSTFALVLAAGGSARLGRPKQLVELGGRPLLRGVIDAVRTWPIDGLAVVLGAHADEILESVDVGDAVVVINPEWEEGIASSLRVGLDTLTRDPHIERTFIALGDQPRIPPDVPTALLDAVGAGKPVVAPRYRYQRGNPVVVDRSLWPRLMSLEGDAGASRLFQAHPEWVHEVQVDHLPPRDIDTESDIADFRAGP